MKSRLDRRRLLAIGGAVAATAGLSGCTGVLEGGSGGSGDGDGTSGDGTGVSGDRFELPDYQDWIPATGEIDADLQMYNVLDVDLLHEFDDRDEEYAGLDVVNPGERSSPDALSFAPTYSGFGLSGFVGVGFPILFPFLSELAETNEMSSLGETDLDWMVSLPFPGIVITGTVDVDGVEAEVGERFEHTGDLEGYAVYDDGTAAFAVGEDAIVLSAIIPENADETELDRVEIVRTAVETRTGTRDRLHETDGRFEWLLRAAGGRQVGQCIYGDLKAETGGISQPATVELLETIGGTHGGMVGSLGYGEDRAEADLAVSVDDESVAEDVREILDQEVGQSTTGGRELASDGERSRIWGAWKRE